MNGSFELVPEQDVYGVFDNVWLNVSDGTSVLAGLNITVEPVGDLPLVSIESVQASGSTANMYWSVLDVDGTVNTAANVYVDGTGGGEPFVFGSGMGPPCVTLLPMSSNPSTSLYLELELFDEELDEDIVSKVVELAAPSDEENQTAPGTAQVGRRHPTAVAKGGVPITGVLVVVVLVRTRSRGGADTSIAAAEEFQSPAVAACSPGRNS